MGMTFLLVVLIPLVLGVFPLCMERVEAAVIG